MITAVAATLVLGYVTALPAQDERDELPVIEDLQKLGAWVIRDEKARDKPAIYVTLRSADFDDAMMKRLVKLSHLQELHLYDARVTGTGLESLSSLRNLRVLNLRDMAITDSDLKGLGRLGQLHELTLRNTKVTGADFKDLRSLTALRMLSINNSPLTDEIFGELGSLTELRALHLGYTKIESARLRELSTLKHLTTLDLHHTDIVDARLGELTIAVPALKELDLGETQVTDAGMKHLAKLPLQSLNLEETAVTDVGLRDVAKLSELRDLGLVRTKVTDAGLKELARLTQLRELFLIKTQVTDQGLTSLTGLRELEFLHLDGTAVTADGVARLREKLPKAKVSWFQRPQPSGRTGDNEVKQRPQPFRTSDRGTLRGWVTLNGSRPDIEAGNKKILEAINRHQDRACCLKGSKNEIEQQNWRISGTGGVANAVIWLRPPNGHYFEMTSKDLDPRAAGWKKEVMLDVPHCAFTPHVVVLFPSYVDPDSEGGLRSTGQVFKIRNSSEVAHHFHWSGGKRNATGAADSQPDKVDQLVQLRTSPLPVMVSCTIHPWMRAYVWVLEHPYAAVTDRDGYFEIRNVPAGVKVRIVGWHEEVGWLTAGLRDGYLIEIPPCGVKRVSLTVTTTGD